MVGLGLPQPSRALVPTRGAGCAGSWLCDVTMPSPVRQGGSKVSGLTDDDRAGKWSCHCMCYGPDGRVRYQRIGGRAPLEEGSARERCVARRDGHLHFCRSLADGSSRSS